MNFLTVEGPDLDRLVAQIEGKEVYIYGNKCFLKAVGRNWYKNPQGTYSPSTDWADGGPIIHRENIMLEPGGENGAWCGHIFLKNEHANWLRVEGPTPLIAAMRCLVGKNFNKIRG